MSLLRVENLQIGFRDEPERTPLVDGVSFSLSPGETLGFVGESGSGKSLTSLSLLELLPDTLRRSSGRVLWSGKSLNDFSDFEKQSLRGQLAAMIFQNPLSALHPCYRIAEQIYECFHLARTLKRSEYHEKAVSLLREVGIIEPEQRLRAYPHELSGGMAQRVVIAMALARDPKVLIADEPTTALDVTIQAQVLRKLIELQRQRGLALILVSHDLGVIAHMTQKIMVFYAGQVVEAGATREVLNRPRHPYTRALLKCRPHSKVSTFPFIRGQVPSQSTWTQSCRFAPRCENARAECQSRPVPVSTEQDHTYRCLFPLLGDSPSLKEEHV